MSCTPASWRRRLTAGEATRPVPRGAGMSYTSHGQHTYARAVDGQFTECAYPDGHTAAFPALLCGQRVRFAEGCTPITSPDRKNAELGDNDGSPDGSGDFLRRLDSQPDVSFRVADYHDSLESCTLTGTSLLLYGFDLRSHYRQSKSSTQHQTQFTGSQQPTPTVGPIKHPPLSVQSQEKQIPSSPHPSTSARTNPQSDTP